MITLEHLEELQKVYKHGMDIRTQLIERMKAGEKTTRYCSLQWCKVV